VLCEEHRQIQYDSDHGCGDGGKNRSQVLIAAQILDEGSPGQYPKEARNKGRPGADQPANNACHDGIKSMRMMIGSHESHKLGNHDQGAWRGLGQSQAIEHLLWFYPSVVLNCLLCQICQHGVGSAEGHHGCLTEEDLLLNENVIPSSNHAQQDNRCKPKYDGDCDDIGKVALLGAIFKGTGAIMNRAVIALLMLRLVALAQQPALTLSGRIELPNVKGRIDHFSADVKGRRLFMAALGNHTVEALDIQRGKRFHTIPDLDEPQGVLYDASSNHLFVACAKDGTTKLFDAATFQILATIKFSGDADNIRYHARDQQIVVGYGDGALGLLDSNGKQLGEVALDAHPESFQIEKAGSRVFVNVPDRKQIEVLDLGAKSVVFKWPVTSALRNYPMALDEAHHRLLIGCRSAARMLAFDTETGKQTASVEIVGDTDDLFYDAAKSRVYVIGGQGGVDVFQQKDPDHYERLEHIATAPGARTGLMVPDWGKLFVAVPHRSDQPAVVLIYDTK